MDMRLSEWNLGEYGAIEHAAREMPLFRMLHQFAKHGSQKQARLRRSLDALALGASSYDLFFAL